MIRYSIPFYSLFKLVFFLWLSLPQTEGSTYLFNTLLAPTFHEHERDIDAFLSSLKSRLSGALLNVLNWAWARAKKALDVSASLLGLLHHPDLCVIYAAKHRSHEGVNVFNGRSETN